MVSIVKTEVFRSHAALMGALRLAIKEIEKCICRDT